MVGPTGSPLGAQTPEGARLKTETDNSQGTLKAQVNLSGRGLHTARRSSVTIHPAPPNHGIVFHVAAKAGATAKIPADWRRVRRLPLCTTLSDGQGVQVRTVEHLLAACYACGLDNTVIEVQGNEIPLLDGSAKPFIDSIAETGIERQPAHRKTLRITKTLQVKDGPRWVKVEPHDTLRVAVQTYFKPVGRLPWWEQEIRRENFADEIGPARTYGLLGEGLAAKFTTWFWRDPVCLGVNSRNAISVWRGRVITPGGLRYPDEYSRHRVLDWVGDLMLAGADIQAKFTCFSPTHHLAQKTLETIFRDDSCHETLV